MIVKKERLNEKEKQLCCSIHKECCRLDGQSYWNPFIEPEAVTAFYLLYTEEHTLACIASASEYDDFIELTVFTRPELRRCGYGREMVMYIKNTSNDIDQSMVFCIDTSFTIQKKWLIAAFSLQLQASEYLMQYQQSNFSIPSSHSLALQLIPCNSISYWASLHATCFAQEPELSADFFIKDHSYRICIEETISFRCIGDKTPIRHGTKRLNIGVCTLLPQSDRLFLSAFGILPAFRHRGFAKKALDEICHLPNINTILLQVSSKNPEAFLLYQSYGFSIIAQNDVWRIG